MNFLKYVLATIVGLIFFSFIAVMTFIVFISAVSAEEEVAIKPNSVLHLKLNKPIIERGQETPFGALPFGQFDNRTGLIELMEAVRHAKNDDNIKGIFLEPQFVQAGYASLQEVREVLEEFKESGKFIYAYGEMWSEADYYLASIADEVFLNPEGLLEFNGLSTEIVFLKGTLEKLGIEPQIFRVGEFKSAIEPLVRKDMSEENRLQTSSFINSIYDTYLSEVAESRKMTVRELRQISEGMLSRNAQDALNYQLVDQLSYFDEVQEKLREKIGLEEGDKINAVGAKRYRKSYTETNISMNRVAVIVASGGIVSGKGDRDNIGSDKFAAEIRKARKNDRIKAIVLRINSPGGSALASDVMWREIKLASQEKPVIASMSDLAASGGYYMAMATDTIVAHPNTITGSIGIFGVLFNMQDFLNEKLGVTTDRVKTGQYSDIMTVSRPLTEFEKQIYQDMVEEGYETFVTKAAMGRDMRVEDMKKIAGGRVWTGEQALDIGLVDKLGGLDEAIAIAVDAAGLEDDYKVTYYPEPKPFFEEFIEEFNTELETRILRSKAEEIYPYIKAAEEVDQYKGIQARMPFKLNIE